MFSVVNNQNTMTVSKEVTKAQRPASREWQNIEILRAIKQGDFSRAKGFSGWGGLSSALRNIEIQQALSSMLTDAELKSLYNSVSSAYFTPKNIAQYCWQLAEQLGFQAKPLRGNLITPWC